MSTTPTPMTFLRFGRGYHLRLVDAGDLEALLELDEAHWVATGAPVQNYDYDATFLSLLDSNGDGRIMCLEVKAAVRWLLDVLADRSGIAAGSNTLNLAALDTGHPDGRAIHQSMRKMLQRLGHGADEEVRLDQVRTIKSQLGAMPISEAGVVLPEAAKDDGIQQFLSDVVATTGGTPHPSGKAGVGQEQLQRFLEDVRAYVDWHQQGQLAKGQTRSEILPLGEATQEAFAALSAVRDKVNQYFAQCDALAMAPELSSRFGLGSAESKATDLSDPAAIEQMLKRAPLAPPRPDCVLHFDDGINLAYAAAMERLQTRALRPALEEAVAHLSRALWAKAQAFFCAYEEWVDAKPGAAVELLGIERLQTYREPSYGEAVNVMIQESRTTAFALENIRLIEKLICYQSFMLTFLNNFVSFPHMFDAKQRALFEMGTLIMDGRRFDLAVKVEDRAKHVAIAETSSMFVLYVELQPKQGGETLEVAVPVTSGGKGSLCVGKRGVFHSLRDREYDARVTQIVENPISLSEALISPLRRIGRLLTGKIESMTTAAETRLDVATSGAVASIEEAAATQPATAPNPVSAGGGMGIGGLLMGGGVAIAALGSSAAFITKMLADLAWWQILVGLAAALLAVVVPASVVAHGKLRTRDLSAILEGCGWSINARMHLTRAQCLQFTHRPGYPPGTSGLRWTRWRRLVVGALITVAVAVGAHFIWGGKPKNARQMDQEPTAEGRPTGGPGPASGEPGSDQASLAEVPLELRADLGERPAIYSRHADPEDTAGKVELGTVETWMHPTLAAPPRPGVDSVGAWVLRRLAYEEWALDWDLLVYETETGEGILAGTYPEGKVRLVAHVYGSSGTGE